MCILTIINQGTKIRAKRKRIYLEKDEKVVYEIHAVKLSSLFLFGNIQLTNQAASELTRADIPIFLFSVNGSLKAQILPFSDKNIDLRLSQIALMKDDQHAATFAKQFLKGKICTYKNFTEKAVKNGNRFEIAEFRKQLLLFMEKIESCASVAEMLGYEGAVSKEYFRCIDQFFTNELKFVKRTKRPPQNEVNALLSFGYSLLYSLITRLCYASGLDPYIGFLHKPRYNRASLALDILELFRVPVVDNFVLSLCNKGILNKSHFEQNNSYMLRKDGLQIFTSRWKKLIFGEDEFETGWLPKITKSLDILIAAIRQNQLPELEAIFK